MRRDLAEDAELLKRYLDGDRHAFTELVERYQRPLFKLAHSYLKNQDDAADVVQKAFVQVLGKASTFRYQSQFRTWLYKITLNLCRNHIRDEGRLDALPEDHDLPSQAEKSDEQLIDQEDRRRLYKAVEELSEKQKAIVHLRIYDVLSFKEIAKIVGGSVASAKVNFHYAMKNLKKVLNDEDDHG